MLLIKILAKSYEINIHFFSSQIYTYIWWHIEASKIIWLTNKYGVTTIKTFICFHPVSAIWSPIRQCKWQERAV